VAVDVTTDPKLRDREMAQLLGEHQAAVQRLAEVPGLGVDRTPRNRSSLKSVQAPPHFLRRNTSRPGWAFSPERTKARV
jgi:hypothetical protein